MSKIIDTLNEEQKGPALNISGSVLVTAGAGSGKTRLLTHRIAHIVRDAGVSPYNILAITFTNKATNEMKERLEKMIDNASNMWIMTFHSMCSRILRVHGEKIGFGKNFTIYGDAEKTRTIKRLYVGEKTAADINSISWHISNAKNKLLSPNQYQNEINYDKKCDMICDLYAKYQNELKTCNAMDFDDLLMKTYELFMYCPEVLNEYQSRFQYIHVDEFQDTNYAQYKLVKMLASKHKNIFVVGDEDQCIYSWRGAEFSNIQKFQDDFKNTKVYKLEQNYRSKKHILDKANKIIGYNTNRLDKKLWTENEDGEDVNYFTGYNDHEEAEWISQKIKNLVSDGKYEFKDFAILMRVNALSRVIEEKFLNYQIPHQVFGGFKFFERKEIKDVIAYLKVLSNPKDNDSFVRVLSFPKKGIGEASISKILGVAFDNNMSVFDVVNTSFALENSIIKKCASTAEMLNYFQDKIKAGISLFELTKEVIEYNKIKEAFSTTSEEDISKKLNIDNFINSTFEFENNNPECTIDDYLQSITLSRDIDNLDEKENFVSIMTIHSAKGLEFKVVFLIGLCEGLLPISRALYSTNNNDLEEERRLMYVATTRAKEMLYYTRPNSRFVFESKRTEMTMPSRFLREAGFEEKRKEVDILKKNDYSDAKQIYFNDDNDIEESKPKVSIETISEYMKFKKGSKVSHPSFGLGEVIVEVTDSIGAFVTVRFEKAGIKTLSLKFAPLTLL